MCSVMAKKERPSYVLTLPLMCNPYETAILDERFHQAERIYNQVLKYANIRLVELKRNKKYKRLLKTYSMYKQLEEQEENRKEKSNYTKLKNETSKELKKTQLKFKLSEYQLHEYVKVQYQKYKGIDSNTGQKIASTVWRAVETNLYGKGKKLHFKKYGQLNSIEGKSNTSGIRFKDGWLTFKGLIIKAKVRQEDEFAQECLSKGKIKYCRLVKKHIRRKLKFYIQLVFEGFPPPKRWKDGSFKPQSPNERVGLDIGPSSLAVVSNKKCLLTELAQGLENYDRKKRLLLRKLDRSRRATNPDYYNEDGTIKKGIKLNWVRSNNYLKTLYRLKDIERKRVAYRKQSHETLANEVLTLGNDIYIESMNFKALQKRSTKTEISEKTGRFKRKKRFGKSIGTHAPSLFIDILKRKLAYQGKVLHQVNTTTFKASQFNHVTGEYTKKELSERWNVIENERIQRDLYSAFLLMNSQQDLFHTDIERCHQTYETFKDHHQRCLEELATNKEITLLSSFGLTKKR